MVSEKASPPNSRASGPSDELNGVRVIDFSTVMAGPYCTRVLADLGAEVIKVEPGEGDSLRFAAPLRDGASAYFGMLNAGKQSIVLDLKNPADMQVAKDLIESAHIVVESFRPGVMARLGLDYESVQALNPAVVYCSISGFGQDGVWAERPGVAQTVHAMSGYDLAQMSLQDEPDRPLNTGLFVADGLSGALAVGMVLAGLRAAERTGVGRYVDLSLVESLLSMMVWEVQSAQFAQGFERKGYGPVRASDGYVMIAPVSERNFASLTRVLQRPDLLTDPRFKTMALRWRHMTELRAVLGEWAASRTADQCEQQMLAGGVPSARYRTVAELFDEPHFVARGTFVRSHDSAGEFRVVRTPKIVRPGQSDAPQQLGRVHELGEDSERIRAELSGGKDDMRS